LSFADADADVMGRVRRMVVRYFVVRYRGNGYLGEE
jgi:hypothetical protein